ncbi:NUDIX hydrolase [Paenibacillus assamensis]|uniref:NUDIX hydrolase n=1 Tax=Paenibacillus assamensis TaxID=311244 RepID=UPI00041194B5|nr:NUDIX hydrolase [Paenibacillus assamensis]
MGKYTGRRELLEETGYECGHMHYLGQLFPASWRCNEVAHVFYTDEILSYTEQSLEAHERIQVVKIKVEECLNQIRDNQIQDSELTYAILQVILKGMIVR